MVDLVFWGLILVSALIGSIRGIWVTTFGIAGLVTGYLGAYTVGPALGSELSIAYGWPRLIGMLAGGIGVFVAGNVAWKIISWVHVHRRRKKELAMESWERVAGFTLGGVQGGVMSVLLLWCLTFLPPGHQLREKLELNTSPTIRFFAPLMRRLARSATRVALGDSPATPLVLATLEKPEETAKKISEVAKSDTARSLSTDSGFKKALESGDATEVTNNPAYKAFTASPEADQLLNYLDENFEGEFDQEKKKAFWAESAWAFVKVSGSGEIRKLMGDPEVQKLIQERDMAKLIKHPKIRQFFLEAGEAGVSAPNIPAAVQTPRR